MTVEELEEIIQRKDVIALPLFLYDHSGLSMHYSNSAYPYNSRWDCAKIGYIYVTYEDIRKEYSKRRLSEKTLNLAYKVLKGEVKTYDLYLRGLVFRYYIVRLKTCKCCKHVEEERIDSCGGYYGDITRILDDLQPKWKTAYDKGDYEEN